MSLSKSLYDKRRIEGIKIEKDVLDYFRRHPQSSPDGSFAVTMYVRGFRQGRADLRKELEAKNGK